MNVIRRLSIALPCLLLGACAPSDHALTSLARHGAIQAGAPVQAVSCITIHAPTDVVWRMLTDVVTWPRWQPGVAIVSGGGHLGVGTAFAWQTGSTTIHSRVEQFDPPHQLTWIGHASMARAIHVFVLTPLGPHDTWIESRESMDGPLLNWFYDSADLQSSEDTLLKNLKRAAEAMNASSELSDTPLPLTSPLQALPHQRK